MTSKSFTRDQLNAALRKHDANFTLGARSLGISRADFVLLVERYAELKTIQEDARGELIDLAETNIRIALRKGNLEISRWTLEHLHYRYGKDAKPEPELVPKGRTPEQRATDQIWLEVMVQERERRDREGLPPLFAGPEFDERVEQYRRAEQNKNNY